MSAWNLHRWLAERLAWVAVLISAAALVTAVVAWLQPRTVERVHEPTLIEGSASVLLAADQPDIGPFTRYRVNRLNPFVPYQDPGRKQPEVAAGQAGVDLADRWKPTKDEAIVTVSCVEPLTWPTLAGEDPRAPHCVGVIAVEQQPQVLLVRLTGQTDTIPMNIGDVAAGWTLLAISAENLARFRDPAGSEHQLAIGLSDLREASSRPVKSLRTPTKPSVRPAASMPSGIAPIRNRL